MRDLCCIAITLTAALAAGIFTGRRTMDKTPIFLVFHGGPRDGDMRQVSIPSGVHDEWIGGIEYRYVAVRGGTIFGENEIEHHMRYSAKLDRRRPQVSEEDVTDRWSCE